MSIIDLNVNKIISRIDNFTLNSNKNKHVFTDKTQNIYYKMNNNDKQVIFIFPDKKIYSLLLYLRITLNDLSDKDVYLIYKNALTEIIKSMFFVYNYSVNKYSYDDIETNPIKYNFINRFVALDIKQNNLIKNTKNKKIKYMVKFSYDIEKNPTIVFSTVLNTYKKMVIENEYSRVFIPQKIYDSFNGDIKSIVKIYRILPLYDDRVRKGVDIINDIEEAKKFIEIIDLG